MTVFHILKIDPPPPHTPPSHNVDKARLYLIWLFQSASLLGVFVLCVRLGASPWFWISGLSILALLWAGLGWLMWRSASTKDPLAPRSCLMFHMRAGVVFTTLSIFALIWVAGLTLDWDKQLGWGVALCAALFLLAVLTCFVSILAIKNQITPWFQFTAGVTFLPLLIAWSAASVISVYFNPRLSASQSLGQSTIPARQAWSQHEGWMKSTQEPIVIGVALSGGGYRAAAIHAGLLQALSENCTPIRYLSTVSGGAIIGAFYSLGQSPAAFREILIKGPPGLADDILNIWFAFRAILFPSWNSSDTYARYLAHVFFAQKTLRDTDTKLPQLFINATNIEQSASNALRVFYLDGVHPDDGGLSLAEVVAASGTFPGAFQPKRITFPNGQQQRFVDGGVVDNSGFMGLTQALEEMRLPLPDILIISDGGQTTDKKALQPKVEPLHLVARSYGITFGVHQDSVRRQVEWLSEMKSVPIRPLDENNLKALLPFTFSLDPKVQMNGQDLAVEVAGYPTLRELDKFEFEKAFWLGEKLGRINWPLLNGYREGFGAHGPACPEAFTKGTGTP